MIVLRHDDRVLELRRNCPVDGAERPAIVLLESEADTGGEEWLDNKD